MQNDAQLRLFPHPVCRNSFHLAIPALQMPRIARYSSHGCAVVRLTGRASAYRTHELARRVGARFGRVPISAVVVARYESEADVIGTREGQRNHI